MIVIRVNNWEKYNGRKNVERPSWFRFQNNFFTDNKISNLSNQEKLFFIYILCEASRNKNELFYSPESLAETYRNLHRNPDGVASPDTVTAMLDKMVLLKLINIRTSHGRYTDATQMCSTGHNKTLQDSEKQDVLSPPPDGVVDGQQSVEVKGPSPRDLFDLWNEAKHPALSAVKDLTEKRRKRAAKILKKYPALETWEEVFTKLNSSKFCTGQVKPFGDRTKPWKATFDWLLSEDSIAKLLEGTYDR